MELTSEVVHAILMDSFFEEEADKSSFIEGTCVRGRLGFQPEKLEKHKKTIANLCDQLPDEFKAGASFLNACITKDGRQWGEHSDVDELLALGTATGKLTILLERELWQALPGGMPVFKIND